MTMFPIAVPLLFIMLLTVFCRGLLAQELPVTRAHIEEPAPLSKAGSPLPAGLRINDESLKLRCQGNQVSLYIDQRKGIGIVDLYLPHPKTDKLVLHFINFGMLENLTVRAGAKLIQTNLASLQRQKGAQRQSFGDDLALNTVSSESSANSCATAPGRRLGKQAGRQGKNQVITETEMGFKLLKLQKKKGQTDIIISVARTLTSKASDHKIQVSWIDAYR